MFTTNYINNMNNMITYLYLKNLLHYPTESVVDVQFWTEVILSLISGLGNNIFICMHTLTYSWLSHSVIQPYFMCLRVPFTIQIYEDVLFSSYLLSPNSIFFYCFPSYCCLSLFNYVLIRVYHVMHEQSVHLSNVLIMTIFFIAKLG